MKKPIPMVIAAGLLSTPQVALAHVGEHGLAGSFQAGLLHPLLGADHLIMLLAMGVLSAKAASRKGQLGMLTGALLAMLGGMLLGLFSGAVTGMESLILGSLFVAAAAIWRAPCQSNLSRLLSAGGVALLMVHGWAHGVELGGAALAAFAPGMLLGSLSAMLVGALAAGRLSTNLLASSVATSGLLLAAMA